MTALLTFSTVPMGREMPRNKQLEIKNTDKWCPFMIRKTSYYSNNSPYFANEDKWKMSDVRSHRTRKMM